MDDKKIRIIIFCIFSTTLLFGCVNLDRFVRVRGTKNADLHGIRVYQSVPSENHPYKSLGFISAKGHSAFTLIRMDRALENLTIRARELGANAIINWRINPTFGWTVEMEGEAVIFDVFPITPND